MYAGAYHRLESGWQGNLLGSTPTFGAIPVRAVPAQSAGRRAA
nr:MAG TPA: hypothetical protein [Caudoviricetes sp.]